jgi:hypothetical protein
MIPVERRERRELHPTVAQLLVGVAICVSLKQTLTYIAQGIRTESTRVSANHRNLVDLEL